jgi:predicted metal-dependent hydrolase
MQLGLPFTALRPDPPPPAPRTGLRARGMEPPAPAKPEPAIPNPEPRTLNPERGTLNLELVRHPRARRYVIRVRRDGSVRVTIPRGGSKQEARQFAERQRGWIEKHRAQVAQEQARIRESADPDVEREWRERAKRELPARLLELAAAHGLSVARVSVRNQRWRWGSCSRNGHICLNWRLARMPAPIRDYVMIHELMHLKQMNHSPKFWKLVAAACPDHEDARQWLREHARQSRA